MYAIDEVQPSVSSAPRPWSTCVGPVHESIVALRIAICVSGVLASSGTAFVAAATPLAGSAAISSIALRVAATNAAIASCFDSIVDTPLISPGPGSGVMSSTRSTVAFSPVISSWTGSLFANAGRGVHGVLRDGGALAEVRVLDDRHVVGRQTGGPEQRLEHDPRRSVAAGDADLRPLRSLASVIPVDDFANTTEGNLP